MEELYGGISCKVSIMRRPGDGDGLCKYGLNLLMK